ncbi:MAG: DedA family protein [Patescibacteria group bacterium]
MTLETIATWLIQYRYPIVFPLAVLEGPIVMTLGGFLLKLGYFSFWPLYITLMVGDLLADVIWYAVGYWGGRALILKYGHWVNISEELFEKTAAAFHRHQNKVLFLSKITMGLGFALVILITAGAVRIPFRKYLIFNAVGQMAWTGILMSVGYFFGKLYLVVNEGLRVAAIAAFVVIVIAAIAGVSRALRKRDLRNAF